MRYLIEASSWEGFLITTIAIIVVAIVFMSTVGYFLYKRYAKAKHRRSLLFATIYQAPSNNIHLHLIEHYNKHYIEDRSKCRENSQAQSTFVLKKNNSNKRMQFSRSQISRMTPYNIDGVNTEKPNKNKIAIDTKFNNFLKF